MKFKIGDIVKILDNKCGSKITIGEVGEIIEIEKISTDSDNDEDYYYGVKSSLRTRVWYHDYNEIELYTNNDVDNKFDVKYILEKKSCPCCNRAYDNKKSEDGSITLSPTKIIEDYFQNDKFVYREDILYFLDDYVIETLFELEIADDGHRIILNQESLNDMTSLISEGLEDRGVKVLGLNDAEDEE